MTTLSTERPVRVRIAAEADVLAAVLQATEFCRKAGLRDDRRTRIATAVSELARNIIKYADAGEVRVRSVEDAHRKGIEVVVHDRGPGIEDIERALDDHYSSSGTLGLGLPGVRRLMDDFDIESEPGKGTRITVVLWDTP
jgi:serine/threonine-protein kinase RsbT